MDQLKFKMDTVGMVEFTKIFIAAHENERWILTPEEFTFGQPAEVKDAFLEVYHRELRIFHQKMLEVAMPTFQSKGLAKILDQLSEGDVPKQRLNELLDEAIAKK